MKKFKVIITGTSPLMMHNSTLVDPLNPLTKAMKAISSKKTGKTDEDIAEMSRIEFLAGLYTDDKDRVVVPYANLIRSIRDAAAITRKGKLIERGLIANGDHALLVFDGPSTPEALFKDERFVDRRSVRVTSSRVIRTRPVFRDWGAEFHFIVDENVISEDDFIALVHAAGEYTGLGDNRGLGGFGRFQAKISSER